MSASDNVDIWDWVRKDYKRLSEGTTGQRAMYDAWRDFMRNHHHDFASADLAIHTAIDAAQAEGELRWMLFLRHWRLQLWLDGDLKRVLPEAVDLLSLAEDARLRDVPQRICAYHDIVDCHLEMDPLGYHDDIVENSEMILAQLPKRHGCADCARIHLATTESTAGNAKAAQSWIHAFYANAYSSTWSAWPYTVGRLYMQLGQLDDAERSFQEAIKQSRRYNTPDIHVNALLGLAQLHLLKDDVHSASRLLHDAHSAAKYISTASIIPRELEVEGEVAHARGQTAIGVDYLTRAAQQYYEQARYRSAAMAGLRAAELARKSGAEPPAEALDAASHAIAEMPPKSQDVRNRLAAFGRNPVAAPAPASHTEASDERTSLESMLATHIKHGDAHGAAMTLYRIGRACMSKNETRAAVDYLVANALLERALELSTRDREDALGALQTARERLPEGAVAAALTAAEKSPPRLIEPLVSGIPPARWAWIVRGVSAELKGQPVVEPEPVEKSGENGFAEWVDHVSSMTALILRHRKTADRAGCERWAVSMEENAEELKSMIGLNGEGGEIIPFAHGLAAISRGADAKKTQRQMPPPFNKIVDKIIEIAKRPVWEHPGSSPLDLLVERMAQKAVSALQHHDEHRTTRLANLAFRYALMSIDFATESEVAELGRFFQALGALVASEGALIPTVTPPLEKPFPAVLEAVREAGREVKTPDLA